jgi:hypothetical protein
VLIIEDELLIAMNIESCLQDAGAAVHGDVRSAAFIFFIAQ